MQVLLADDHTLFLQGLRSLLEQNPKIKIIGSASDGKMAYRMAQELSPDVVIMDISMPQMDGIEATAMIKNNCQRIKIIILSMHSHDDYVLKALKAGASGYVLKNAAYKELQLALEAVEEGETYLSPGVSQVVIKNYLQLASGNDSMEMYRRLTHREREIILLMGKGYKRQEIATSLVISPKTVDRHQENIKERLDFQRRRDLIPFALSIQKVLHQEGDTSYLENEETK